MPPVAPPVPVKPAVAATRVVPAAPRPVAVPARTVPAQPVAVAAPAPVVAQGAVPATETAPETSRARQISGLTRDSFNIATAVDAAGNPCVDANGKLTAIPANWSSDTHKKLNKEDFADEAVYSDHKANVAERWAARFAASAVEYRQQADQIRKYGANPEVRKTVAKLARMRAEYEKLVAQSEAEGLDMTQFKGGMPAA